VKLKTRNAWLYSFVDDFNKLTELPIIQHSLSMIYVPLKTLYFGSAGYAHIIATKVSPPILTDVQLGREHVYEAQGASSKWFQMIHDPQKPPTTSR
jgi:hypothetical protein